MVGIQERLALRWMSGYEQAQAEVRGVEVDEVAVALGPTGP